VGHPQSLVAASKRLHVMKNFCRQWLENWRHDCRHLRRWQRPCHQDRGAALLEFALTLPILLIITMFLLEMALYWEGRILGNHASFALARIAKVHYQPGKTKEEQTYFPKECLLHKDYLKTRDNLQSELSTERLITAFFLFPVTRQTFGAEDKVATLGDVASKIKSFNDGLIGTILEIQAAIANVLIDDFSENASETITDKIFNDDRIENLLPKLGDGIVGTLLTEFTAQAISATLKNTFQPIFNDVSNNVLNFAFHQYQSFIQKTISPFRNFLTDINAILTGIDDMMDKVTNSEAFIFADFLTNCYSRYDLACQRVAPNTTAGTDLKVWSERLITEGEDDYDADDSSWEKVKNWFASLNPFKSSKDAESQYKAWKKEIKKYKNQTQGCLRFPRHATDAEATAAVIAVSLTYPVKSHWFSLTAAMAEDNTFKPSSGKVAFTCNQATLAELPKQNIEEYFFEYKTIGESSGAGKYLGDFFAKMKNIYAIREIKINPQINLPVLQEWINAQNARRERQQAIIDELPEVESLFANTSDATLKKTKNYARNIDGAKEAKADLDAAITKIGQEKTENSEATGLIEEYTDEREKCYTYKYDKKTKEYKKTKTSEWDKWNARINAIVQFSTAAKQHSDNLKEAIYGDEDSHSPSYEKLKSDESTKWQNLITYYNDGLKTDIELHKYSGDPDNPQPENAGKIDNKDIPGVVLPNQDDLSDAQKQISRKLQDSLDDSRKLIREKIFEAIKDCPDYDLFTSSDSFDSGGPQGLKNTTNSALKAYENLNKYYNTSSQLKQDFEKRTASEIQ
jgi:hypothetical protein